VAIVFTASELRELKAAADLSGMTPGYDIDKLIFSMAQVVDVEALAASLVDPSMFITGAASPAALAAATAGATRQARKITRLSIQAELNKIAEKVRVNIAEGNAFDKLYGKLSEIKGLDSGRAATLAKFEKSLIDQGVTGKALSDKTKKMHDKLLRDRKKTIAQTEQRMATAQGGFENAKKDGDKWKRWITAGDDLVSDMDETNEGQGWIAIDEAFSSGDMVNPSHPNCRCTVTYRTLPPDKFDEARAKQASADTKAAKKQAETDDKAAKEAAKEG
jgi:hypothetical protein